MVQFAPSDPIDTPPPIRRLIHQQRQFFGTGTTQPIAFRLAQLKALRQAVLDHQAAVLAALTADLAKPTLEAYASEIRVIKEIDYAVKHLRAWMKPNRVAVPPELLPARARVRAEPLGVVLIIAPWNYPFQLIISPLIAAIAAGNCVLLKPSELAPHTSRAIVDLIEKTFDPAYIAVVEGGAEVSQAILREKFDHIFFTGGTVVGKLVMAAAANHLTPVTLELGGKSPCIVDRDTDLATTARRIVWGKFINAGQTCIAPDYLLVDRQIASALIDALCTTIRSFYGEDPSQSPDYARIINAKQFDRLVGLLQSGTVRIGGDTRATDRYIAPTVLDHVSLDAPIMQEEIFGPILPVISYETLQEAIDLINAKPKPLALYVFTRNQTVQERILQETSSGSVCVNDTVMQFTVPGLPFGGVGDSGIGSYHGKAGFDTFSHTRSVLYKPFWLDLPWRYAPYHPSKLALLKQVIK